MKAIVDKMTKEDQRRAMKNLPNTEQHLTFMSFRGYLGDPQYVIYSETDYLTRSLKEPRIVENQNLQVEKPWFRLP